MRGRSLRNSFIYQLIVPSEIHFFTSYVKFDENKNQKVLYYFWDSREAFISNEETADMLLIDYFTYIGGLFALCFGICLEILLDLIVKHTRNLRTKVKFQVEKLLSFLYILSLSILHFINNLFRNFMNCMIERVLSILNRISQFRTISDLFVLFINCFENNMFRTHNRVESINL